MPECGSQCYLCDLPIRFDTYSGCSHNCRYCFAQAKKDISVITKHETVKHLEAFIKGKRNEYTKWADWNIPLHWGGLSDPLQPIEAKIGNSYECLSYLVKMQYPFVISTKGRLLAHERYLSLFSQANCVIQISLVSPQFDKIETGCPPFKERLEIIKKVTPRVKRVIIRIQPYMTEVKDDVLNALPYYAEYGVHGIILEGMKFKAKKQGLIQLAGDYVYPYQLLKSHFTEIKERAHKLGLRFYAGENRLREMGDSLTCCGIDGMEAFIPNTFNLNHLLNGRNTEPTEAQKKQKTGACFKGMCQTTLEGREMSSGSFAGNMLAYYKSRKSKIDKIFGKIR